MGSENSETSSDKETRRSVSPNSSKEGLGRSYECNFCKRGFTNAQALGGHMNIHRKDKEKAKRHNTGSSSSKPNKDHSTSVSSKSFNLIPTQEAQYLGSSLGFGTGDHGYQFAPSNPNFQWALAASQFDNRVLHEDQYLRVNLNLGIGSSGMETSNIESTKIAHEDWLENDVDLELRLGHYP